MNRHPFGFGRFLFGLIFCATALAWIGRDHIGVSASHLAFILPAALIATGVVGIVATLRKVNHDQATDT